MKTDQTVAVVLKGYPRLSETFIAQEILSLQKAGLKLKLVSLRHPTDIKRHPIHDEINADVLYLPEYIHQELLRSIKGWWNARRLPGYKTARQEWLKDLRRDPTRNRIRRFVQAMVTASELSDDIRWLYAHFIHTPGSVTRYAGLMRQLPFSFSAHAKDIWTSPDWELREKLNDARWTVTCTKGGADHLSSLAQDKNTVKLVYHGLDLNRFPPASRSASKRDGKSAQTAVQFLSVGRAVEKKGFDILLKALSMLPDDLHWKWTHIAGGPLLKELKQQGDALGLSDRMDFLGSQSQERVLKAYHEADLFVLPCRIAPDGDRDGLPNVIVEAQSQGLPVISTTISGIPELMESGENGLLVPPENAQELADALVKLAQSPKIRDKMGKEGAKRVQTSFDAANEINHLLKLLQEK